MGGKGSAPQNNQMVQFEMQQAAEARQKEEERKARLEKGKKTIDEMFGGKKKLAPKMGSLDFTGAGDPSSGGALSGAFGDTGLTWQKLGAEADPRWASATPQQRAWGLANMPGGFQLTNPAGEVLGSGSTWDELVAGSQGKQFNLLSPTGEIEGGFQQPFYDKFKQASLDYNLPQLTDQYDRMRKNITYDLARAGTLRSTAANEAVTDAEKQKAMNEAAIRAKADQETAGLRSSISSQQQQALNQLYATEDPDIAATTAINMVHNANLQMPQQTPLGDLFKPLVIGALGAYNAYGDQQAVNRGLQSGLTGRQTGSQTTSSS